MQNDLDPKGLDYTTISRIVFECRERQKATGEGDQMLSRWISEALSGHLSAVPDGEGEICERIASEMSAGKEGRTREWMYDIAKEAAELALAASRLSQAGVRVTDEMVERFAAELWKLDDAYARSIPHSKIRIALEAALSGDTL